MTRTTQPLPVARSAKIDPARCWNSAGFVFLTFNHSRLREWYSTTLQKSRPNLTKHTTVNRFCSVNSITAGGGRTATSRRGNISVAYYLPLAPGAGFVFPMVEPGKLFTAMAGTCETDLALTRTESHIVVTKPALNIWAVTTSAFPALLSTKLLLG